MDARRLEQNQTVTASTCIFGAGAAGIVLALELEKKGKSVCLLESGGHFLEPAIQSLYEGEVTGTPYNLAGSRLRYLGGSTNHWSGQCLPLAEDDFTSKEWIAGSGWPFGARTLQPYYEAASSVLGLSEEPESSAESEALHSLRLPGFQTDKIRSRPLRLGEHFRKELEKSLLITLYLYANHKAFRFDNDRVREAEARNDQGALFTVRADHYILATGGIENARILLDQERMQQKIPDKSGLLGRRFMEHYHSPLAILLSRQNSPFQRFQQADSMYYVLSERTDRLGFFAPELALRESAQTANFRIQLGHPGAFDSPLSEFEADLLTTLPAWENEATTPEQNNSSPKIKKFLLYSIVEQSPDHRSRITLSDRVDRHGRPQVHLHWYMNDLDKHTLRESISLFGRSVALSGHGRIRFLHEKEVYVMGGMHHMGTTCMHRSPGQGVVDENLRVHGLTNLYVAGSSVFPTVGHANPTLTILALCLRLVDHLSRVGDG